MERGVRQGSKEGPLLFNITFQLVLDKIFNLAETLGVTLVTTGGVEWQFGHIEYADDLCLIANSVTEAEMLLERLDRVLTGYHMALAQNKTKWMHISKHEPAQSQLHFGEKSIDRVDSFRYLGSPINALGNATDAITNGLASGRRQLMKIGPVLRSTALNIPTKARLVDIFVSSATYYRLSTIVLRKRDNDRISALLNTARRMILGINCRRLLKVVELEKIVRLKYPAASIQQGRLRLWKSLCAVDGLTWKILGSKLKFQTVKRTVSSKCWIRQIGHDARETFSEGAAEWLAHPSGKILANDQHKPQLAGSRP